MQFFFLGGGGWGGEGVDKVCYGVCEMVSTENSSKSHFHVHVLVGKFLKTSLKIILDGRLLSIQDAVSGLGLFSDHILNVAVLIRLFESFTNQMMFHIPLQVVIIIIMQ